MLLEFAFLLILLLSQTVALSRGWGECKRFALILALLEARIYELQQKQDDHRSFQKSIDV